MTALPLKFFDECCDEPAKPWAIKGVIALDEDSSWYGPPGSLKSTLKLDIAVHLAAGRDWRGHKVKAAAGVVIFALERAGLTRRRLAAYAKRDGLKNLPIAVASDIVDLIDISCVETITETVKAAEERFGVPVWLIIIDTFSKGVAAGGGDEDRGQHQNIVAANLKLVHERLAASAENPNGHSIHISTVGHTGKDETKGERGSNAKLGHVDLAVQISGKSVRTAKIVKANDQAEDVLTSFAMEEITIGKDEDGLPRVVGILSSRAFAAAAEGSSRLSDKQVLALDALRTATQEHGQRIAGVQSVEVERWREEMFRSGAIERDAKNPRQDFKRLRDALARSKRIVEQDGFVRMGYAAPVTPPPPPAPAPPPAPSIVPAAGRN